MTDQEAKNVAASVLHLLTQRGVDAREYERQAGEWRAVADRQRKELDELKRRLFYADRALADMVNQYMSYPEGFVTHEFMNAQEEAIDYLESIGWLRAGDLERYYWTDAMNDATKADVPPQSAPSS